MILRTEPIDIPAGEDWTLIALNTDFAFSIQNTAEVMMEYSFTDGISRGSYLTPYTIIADIRQDIYVRFYNVTQSGIISVTRVSDEC